MHTLHVWAVTFFAWPTGSIWSNLLASALLGAGALLLGKRKLDQHHREHMAKLDAIHQHLKNQTKGTP